MVDKPLPGCESVNHDCNNPTLLFELFTQAQITQIHEVRHKHHIDEETLSVCDRVSRELARMWNVPWVEGAWDSPDYLCSYHCWIHPCENVILDCTADQFGLEGIQILRRTDPGASWYRPEIFNVAHIPFGQHSYLQRSPLLRMPAPAGF